MRLIVTFGLAVAAIGASCALNFTDYPIAAGGSTATGAGTPSSGSTGQSSSTGMMSSSAGTNLCGNGKIDPGEQCDDGNHTNLDGCDSECRYEAIARLTQIQLETTKAPAFCQEQNNLFGTSCITTAGFSSLNALTIFNQLLQDGIDSGSTNIMAQVLYLSDLTGTVDATGFSLGLFSGVPDPQKGTWQGSTAANQPIDWWFLVNHTRVDANRLPTSTLPNGFLVSRSLTAGPGTSTMDLTLNGQPFSATIQHAMVAATVDGTPLPDVPPPPPANGLANGIKVFRTITGSAGQGICGDLSVDSLSKIPVPSQLAQGGPYACSNCGAGVSYVPCPSGQVTAGCNSILDVLVSGCVVTCVVAVKPQQPDVAASGGTPTHLSVGAMNKVVNASGDLDGYSIYLTFKGNRVHATGVN